MRRSFDQYYGQYAGGKVNLQGGQPGLLLTGERDRFKGAG
jgi:hypothetical protein